MSNNAVKIENPVPGGAGFTTRNRARRFVRDGRAVFVGSGERAIQFLGQPKMLQPVMPTASAPGGAGYDGVKRMMTLTEVANLPCVQPTKLVTRYARPSRKRHGVVRVIAEVAGPSRSCAAGG